MLTSVSGLRHLTSPLVFQYKANVEGRFSASLDHLYP